jgi:hypothetical protein
MGLRESKGPLRAIIGYVEVPIVEGSRWTVIRERLECGHVVNIRQDIIGPTNAHRRRCRRCRDGDS